MKKQARADAIAEKRTERKIAKVQQKPEQQNLNGASVSEDAFRKEKDSVVSRVVGAGSVKLRDADEEVILTMLAMLTQSGTGGERGAVEVDDKDDEESEEEENQNEFLCEKVAVIEENSESDEDEDEEVVDESEEVEDEEEDEENEEATEQTCSRLRTPHIPHLPPLAPHARRLLIRTLLREDRRITREAAERISSARKRERRRRWLAAGGIDGEEDAGAISGVEEGAEDEHEGEDAEAVAVPAGVLEEVAGTDSTPLHAPTPRPILGSPPPSPHAPPDVALTQPSLPVTAYRSRIVSAISQHRVTVIEGETGSGKSTQVPAYLLAEAAAAGKYCNVVVTQPRRLAAVTLGDRVAYEYGCGGDSKGASATDDGGIINADLVGYQVRLHRRASQHTRLLFCTTGILLRRLTGAPSALHHGQGDEEEMESAGDAYLKSITHIIVDEVHERQMDTDFLLALLRTSILQRRELAHIRVILMSATAQTELIANYFSSSGVSTAVVSVPGRMFPVTLHHWSDVDIRLQITSTDRRVRKGLVPRNHEQEQEHEEQEDADEVENDEEGDEEQGPVVGPRMRRPPLFDADIVADLCFSIASDPKMAVPASTDACGHGQCILVFLSGSDRIDDVRKALHRRIGNGIDLPILLLHGTQTPESQRQAFIPAPAGKWRVVLSTNIAETSVTVPDVTHVIDAGTVKQVSWDAKSGTRSLKEQLCSLASMRQRAGRAGRVREGHCWRLYWEPEGGTEDVGDTSSSLFAAIRAGTVLPTGYVRLRAHDIPEICRVPLEETILQAMLLLAVRTDAVSGWTYPSHSATWFLQQCIQPPAESGAQACVHRLCQTRALVSDGQHGFALTPLGAALARLPTDIRLGKMLILGAMLSVGVEACALAAILSCKSIFLSTASSSTVSTSAGAGAGMSTGERGKGGVSRPKEDKGAAATLQARRLRAFCPDDIPSDHLMRLNVYAEYRRLCAVDAVERAEYASAVDSDMGTPMGVGEHAWNFCRSYGLSRSVLEEVHALKRLYWQALREGYWVQGELPKDISVDASSSTGTGNGTDSRADAETTALLMFCLSFGMAPNVARLGRVAWKGQERGKAPPRSGQRGSGAKANPGTMIFTDRDQVDLYVHPRTSFLGPTVSHLIATKGKSRVVMDRKTERKYAVKDAGKASSAVPGSGHSYSAAGVRRIGPRTMRYGVCPQMSTYKLGGSDSYFMYYSRLQSSRTFLADCTVMPAVALLVFGSSGSGDRSGTEADAGIKIAIGGGKKGGGGANCSIFVDGWLRIKASELHAVLFKRLAYEVDKAIHAGVFSNRAVKTETGTEAREKASIGVGADVGASVGVQVVDDGDVNTRRLQVLRTVLLSLFSAEEEE